MGSRILHLRIAPGPAVGRSCSPPGPESQAHLAAVCDRLTPDWRLGDDGVYLNLTGTGRLLGRGLDGAIRAGRDVRACLVLPAAGLACSVLGAGLASRLALGLGGGVFAVPPTAEAAFLARFPVSCLPGARAETERLLRLGVRTLGDLQVVPRALLSAVFGQTGLDLADQAAGLGPGLGVPGGRPGSHAILVVGAGWHRPLTSPAALAALRRAVAIRALRQVPHRAAASGRWGLTARWSCGERTQTATGRLAGTGWLHWRDLVERLWAKLPDRRRGLTGLELSCHGCGGSGSGQGSLFAADAADGRLAEVIRRAGGKAEGGLGVASEELLSAMGIRWYGPG